jgi:hypothetical protein
VLGASENADFSFIDQRESALICVQKAFCKVIRDVHFVPLVTENLKGESKWQHIEAM